MATKRDDLALSPEASDVEEQPWLRPPPRSPEAKAAALKNEREKKPKKDTHRDRERGVKP